MAKTYKKTGKKRARGTKKRATLSSFPKFMKVDTEKDIAGFEKMLRKNPITIVMVYLGWCGHCQKAKPNFMEVAKKNHPGVGFALLNGDMQEKTSLNGIKVEGVPEFVINANVNGKMQSIKVPISYEKNAIERLANASVATVNDLPPTLAISNKTPAELLATVKRNNAGNVQLRKTANEAINIINTFKQKNSAALPVPDSEVDMASSLMFDESQEKIGKPEEIYEGPLMINSLNPMSITSPIATLMNMTRRDKNTMNGGHLHLQPHGDPIHPGKFIVTIPGKKTVRGKYSTVAKAIRKYEGVT